MMKAVTTEDGKTGKGVVKVGEGVKFTDVIQKEKDTEQEAQARALACAEGVLNVRWKARAINQD
jgi:hypothetical protein